MYSHSPLSQPVIEALPPPTQSKLRSTQILTSLPQLLSELVQNSLDAKAHQVDVGVDCEEWECWVRDDGVGMRKDDLARLARGLKDGRYNTSKAYTPASLEQVTTFGFRGEALASAADVSSLEISSRTARSRDSWSIILKGGDCLYSGPSLRWRRESHGTVVSIRDAFFNLPIRRRSHSTPQKTISLIRKDMEIFSLMFPEVSFTLEETKKVKYGHSERVPQRVLTIPRTKSVISTFRHLYGRALAEHVDEIHEKREDLCIDGFISLEGAQSKSQQFLYINRHPLAPCDLHRVIDNKFSASSFSKHAFEEHGETSQLRSTLRRSPRKSEKRPVFVLNITVPPQQVDNCLEPTKAAVHLRDSEAVSNFLSSIIQDFLFRHGFSTAAPPGGRQQSGGTRNDHLDSPSPQKRRKLSAYVTVSPTRPGLRAPRANTRKYETPFLSYEGDDDDSITSLVWTDPHTNIRYAVDKRTGNSYRLDASAVEESTPSVLYDHESTVFDKSRHKSRRTIGIRRLGQDEPESTDTPQWIQKALTANRAYALPEHKIPSIAPIPVTISTPSQPQHRLCRGDNGIFHARWHDITSLPWDDINISVQRRLQKDDLNGARIVGQVDQKFVACVIEGLRPNGEQTKKIEKSAGATLILVDQHAADERVRVERFLKEVCVGFLQHDQLSPAAQLPLLSQKSKTRTDTDIAELLDPPVPVLLTHQEAAQIVNSEETRKVFERWGLGFTQLDGVPLGVSGSAEDDLDEDEELDILRRWQPKPQGGRDRDIKLATGADKQDKENGYSQVIVNSVPALLRDKLLMNNELRDLIKSTLIHLEIVGCPRSGTSTPSASEHQLSQTQSRTAPWQRALRWCSPHLLDLINSKACRGAIMFNDPLTMEQCQRLIGQLGRTDAPFVCAHGRPSLVPLLEISVGEERQGHKEMRSKVDWAKFMAGSRMGGDSEEV